MKVVLGLGFGDEGKGTVVNWLSGSETINVRFSGGQNVGHNVHHMSEQHVFSSFGSGTFKGASTLWSAFCPIDISLFLQEKAALQIKLKKLGKELPGFFIGDSVIITPFEVMEAMSTQALTNGTTGVGIRAVHQRQEDYYGLTVRDLFFDTIWKHKLEAICSYYEQKWGDVSDLAKQTKDLITNLRKPFLNSINFIKDFELPRYDTVFEGSQGIMLDPFKGFFPNVTADRTDLSNIRNILTDDATVYFVTRTYSTRHGNGPFIEPNPAFSNLFKGNPHETNKDNPIQGLFRTAPLNFQWIKYALESSEVTEKQKKVLMINHVDAFDDKVPYYDLEGNLQVHHKNVFLKNLSSLYDFSDVYINDSPNGNYVKL